MYDVAVIGSGWAGFNAALFAAKHKLTVCLIEKEHLGGACLNYGCIPTKAFVASATHLYDIKHSADFGIDADNPRVNFEKIHLRKNAIVVRLRQGLESLIKAQKIDFIQGEARLINASQITINNQVIEAKNIVIASGSRPKGLPNLQFDGAHILSSTDLLNLKTIPKNLLIIGGGVIGCEFAAIFARFGVKVTIVEILDRLLVGVDKEASKKMEIAFKKNGVTVLLGTNFSALNLADFDRVLLSVGRSAGLDGLGLSELGVKIEKSGICVDEYLRTNIPNIYAVGDCIGRYQLAHVASYEGRIAAENILGGDRKADYTAIPNCIFTCPEIGSVGLSEDEAKAKGYNVKTAKFNFLALGMAHIKGETDGFIKIVVDSSTEKILGAVIMGIGATELISALTLAVRNKLTIRQVYETIFPHPALSECIAEAAHNFYEL